MYQKVLAHIGRLAYPSSSTVELASCSNFGFYMTVILSWKLNPDLLKITKIKCVLVPLKIKSK